MIRTEVYFGALAAAVANATLEQAAIRSKARLQRAYARQSTTARLARALFIVLPILWLFYGAALAVSIRIAQNLSPAFGLACLFTFLAAGFIHTYKHLKGALLGVI